MNREINNLSENKVENENNKNSKKSFWWKNSLCTVHYCTILQYIRFDNLIFSIALSKYVELKITVIIIQWNPSLIQSKSTFLLKKQSDKTNTGCIYVLIQLLYLQLFIDVVLLLIRYMLNFRGNVQDERDRSLKEIDLRNASTAIFQIIIIDDWK